MKPAKRIQRTKKSGAALISTFIVMTLLAVASATYINSATQSLRTARRQTMEVQTTHLCEAGVQSVLRALWRPFKVSQNFANIDANCGNATTSAPYTPTEGTGSITGVGKFTAGVIKSVQPSGDTYTRLVTVRSVGWIDTNNNGTLDSNEPSKIIDVIATYSLTRSQVFDYAYFVNNYGWMDGFDQNNLIVNGDMRANGDFKFTNGAPTVNGSVYASANDKLSPPVPGLINDAPVKWTNATYLANNGTNARTRQAYDSTKMGAKGSSQYEAWRDFAFESTASVLNSRTDGAVVGDSRGIQGWTRTSSGNSTVKTMLDSTPTQEVAMPDLSNITYYTSLSTSYLDSKATFGDGTANPNYNQGAYVDAWDPTANGGTGAYKRISNNGVVTGSAALIGTASNPIKIHGPVTFTQDAVIKGYVSGQGTIYTGRNVHVVGSIVYSNPPDFRGSSQTAIDNANEKKDVLALAARGSVMLGDVSTFGTNPLQYMTPPFTKGRYDENGNWIPPYDATQTDSTGFKKYQSVMGDSYIHSISSGVGQIDAVLYTNFVGGGNIGTSAGGVQFNGSIISKDEAMVTWSLPLIMNYDSRIRERSATQTPLIDIQLPRSPMMLRSTWKDKGFFLGG